MLRKKHLYYLFSGLLVIIFIFPFVYLAKYTILISDDLCRFDVSSGTYFENVQEWYLTHNGRYINALISSLPAYNITTYRVIIASQFLVLGIMLYRFVHEILKLFEIDLKNFREIFLTVLVFIVLIAKMPSLFEFFYWYAASTVYLFSFIFFLLFLEFAVSCYFGKKWNFYLTAFLIIFVNGNNELLIGLSNLILFALLINDFLRFRKLNMYLIALNIISGLSSLFLIVSPGTISRQAQHSYGENLIGSIKVAIIYGGKYILTNLFEMPYFLFLIFIFLFIHQKAKFKNYIPPSFLFLISYLSMTSIFFIVYYATGLFQVYTGRIGNLTSLIFLIFAVLNLINLAVYLKGLKNYRIFNSKYIPHFLVIILLSILILKNKNYTDLREDIVGNNLDRFEKKINERNLVLQGYSGDTLVLEKIEGTKILRSGDVFLVSEEWVRQCYTVYINKKYNLNVKKLIFKDPQD